MTARALVVASVLAVTAIGCGSTRSFAAYRQTQVEEVPGAFDWELLPLDAGYRAAVRPEAAYASVYGAGRRPEAIAILGQVRNTLEDTLGPPAWIFITPDTCFATEKGDLVSPGRSGDGCTEDNLYVQGVDATTGATLGGFSAYEPPGGWNPARAGTPSPVVATTAEGTTQLR